MIVIGQNFVLSDAEAALSLDHPVILWRNCVTFGNVTAETADANYPISNVANPATNIEWRAGNTNAQEITIATNTAAPLDALGIAKHNFGSAGISAEVGYYDGVAWVSLAGPRVPANDGPLLFRFTAQGLAEVVIRLGAGSSPARIAVIYCEKLLVLERKIWVGHTPIPYGRRANILTGKSAAGDFLGRIVLDEFVETKQAINLLSPEWYRAYLDPFFAVHKSRPFFFSWRPQTYPLEVGYAWMVNDPQPVHDDQSHLIQVELEMEGIAA